MRPFARFYTSLDKADRMDFRKAAMPLLGIPNSTFYYRVHHGNMFPSDLLKIKHLMINYGCTQEMLLSMGIMEQSR